MSYYSRNIVGIYPAPDGSYYIYGAYHGYDDGTTNDTLQSLVSRLYGLNVGIHEVTSGTVRPLQIAPNPSTGATTFSTTGPVHKKMLNIHDTSGRAVLHTAWPAGSSNYILPAGTLAPGTYVVRAQEDQRTLYTGKLIILP